MASKIGRDLPQYAVLSVSAKVEDPNSIPQFSAINLKGEFSEKAVGVANVFGEKIVAICILGTIPCRVENGQTIKAGDPLSPNSNGQIKLANKELGETIIGYAIDEVENANGDYITIFVNANP